MTAEHYEIGEIAIDRLTQERVIVTACSLGGQLNIRRMNWGKQTVGPVELQKCGQDTGE